MYVVRDAGHAVYDHRISLKVIQLCDRHTTKPKMWYILATTVRMNFQIYSTGTAPAAPKPRDQCGPLFPTPVEGDAYAYDCDRVCQTLWELLRSKMWQQSCLQAHAATEVALN